MSKIGKNKKRCEKYKNSGHREENKRKKQERHEKLMARFARRKEEGKSYGYKKGHAQEKIDAAVADRDGIGELGINYNLVTGKWISNYKSHQDKHSEVSKRTSRLQKVKNYLTKKAEEERDKEKTEKKAMKKSKEV